MSAYTFSMSGTITCEPASGFPSGDPEIITPLQEAVVLKRRVTKHIDLESDAPLAVSLDSMTAAHVLTIRSSAYVRVQLTFSNGDEAAISCDPLLQIIALSFPITVIVLTRLAGGDTVAVNIFLGERA